MPESTRRIGLALDDGSAAFDLRPLKTGELIDLTFQFYRRHFVKLFLIGCIIYSLPLLLNFLLTLLGWKVQPSLIRTQPHIIGALLGCYLFILIVTRLGQGTLTYFISELYLGRSTSIRSAFLFLRKRMPAMLGMIFLKTVILTAAFGLILLPPIGIIFFPQYPLWLRLIVCLLLCLILFIPGLILAVRYLLTTPAVMLENKGGWLGLKRSSELIRFDPRLGFMYWGETRISVILLVLFCASILIGLVSSIPALASRIPEVMRGNYNDLGSLPSGIIILTHLLNFIGSSVVEPLYAIATTFFYYDIRIRKEGFDLQLLAKKTKR